MAPLLVGESVSDVELVLAGNGTNFGKDLLSLVGQVQGIVAAVGGVSPSFKESTGFEIVDEGHDLAGHNAKQSGQGLLALAWTLSNQSQDASVGRRQIESNDLFGKARRGVRAELSDKKGIANDWQPPIGPGTGHDSPMTKPYHPRIVRDTNQFMI